MGFERSPRTVSEPWRDRLAIARSLAPTTGRRPLHSLRASPLRARNSAFAPFGLAVPVAPRVFYRLPPELAAAAPLRSAPPSRSSRPLRFATGTLIVVRESR